MKSAFRNLAWMGALSVTSACGGARSACEVSVNGVDVCVNQQVTVDYCESEWGGAATRSASTADPTCADLGYATECSGMTLDDGGSQMPYSAASDADCAAADGGALAG